MHAIHHAKSDCLVLDSFRTRVAPVSREQHDELFGDLVGPIADASSDATTARRIKSIDWLLRHLLPRALRKLGADSHATTFEALPEFTTEKQVRAAHDAVYAAYEATYAIRTATDGTTEFRSIAHAGDVVYAAVNVTHEVHPFEHTHTFVADAAAHYVAINHRHSGDPEIVALRDSLLAPIHATIADLDAVKHGDEDHQRCLEALKQVDTHRASLVHEHLTHVRDHLVELVTI